MRRINLETPTGLRVSQSGFFYAHADFRLTNDRTAIDDYWSVLLKCNLSSWISTCRFSTIINNTFSAVSISLVYFLEKLFDQDWASVIIRHNKWSICKFKSVHTELLKDFGLIGAKLVASWIIYCARREFW